MNSELPSYEQAAAIVANYARTLAQQGPRTERVDLARASDRILSKPLRADDDQPPFPRSTRDGYACRAAEASAHIALPVLGSTHAGETPAGPLPAGSAWEIMTGAPVPESADCVVMLEHVENSNVEKSAATIRLLPPRIIQPGDNVVAQGAQARRGDELLAAGIALGPAQVALAASCGYSSIDVFVRPRVAILTTGDELVAIDATPGPGKIRNSNAPMLAALVARSGGEPIVMPTAADTSEALDVALVEALTSDMLLISGGVSAGKYDLVEPALARLGARFHFTGVKIQPGKPLVFGEIPANVSRRQEVSGHDLSRAKGAAKITTRSSSSSGRQEVSGRDLSRAKGAAKITTHSSSSSGRHEVSGHDFSRAEKSPELGGALAPEERRLAFLGLPGNPISTAATFLLFAAPILAALAGSRETYPRFLLAHLSRDTDRNGKPGLTRFLPARCTFSPSLDQLPQVATVPWHGSGDLAALARSNCFLAIPEDAGFLEAGSIVRILLP